MEYNDLINEFLDLLDKNENVLKLKELKEILLKDQIFLNKIEEYKIKKNVFDKIKLYENNIYVSYLRIETNINLMIQEIKNKFKIFNSRKCLK